MKDEEACYILKNVSSKQINLKIKLYLPMLCTTTYNITAYNSHYEKSKRLRWLRHLKRMEETQRKMANNEVMKGD